MITLPSEKLLGLDNAGARADIGVVTNTVCDDF
jgi:hypothetical protein